MKLKPLPYRFWTIFPRFLLTAIKEMPRLYLPCDLRILKLVTIILETCILLARIWEHPIFRTDVKAIIGSAGGLNWWAPAAEARSQFGKDDQRRSASFVEIYTIESGDSSFLTSVVIKARGFAESGTQRFLDDIVIYRYGELLLMKAEAKNALGQDPTEEMNKIRMRAYGDNFAAHEFVNGTQTRK